MPGTRTLLPGNLCLPEPPEHLALSAGGELLAAWSAGRLSLWECRSNRCLAEFQVPGLPLRMPEYSTRRLRFEPSGRFLLVALGSFLLLDLRHHRPVFQLSREGLSDVHGHCPGGEELHLYGIREGNLLRWTARIERTRGSWRLRAGGRDLPCEGGPLSTHSVLGDPERSLSLPGGRERWEESRSGLTGFSRNGTWVGVDRFLMGSGGPYESASRGVIRPSDGAYVCGADPWAVDEERGEFAWIVGTTGRTEPLVERRGAPKNSLHLAGTAVHAAHPARIPGTRVVLASTLSNRVGRRHSFFTDPDFTVYDLGTGRSESLHLPEGHVPCSLAVDPLGKRIALGLRSGQILLDSIPTAPGEVDPRRAIRDCRALSPSGEWVALGCENGEVLVFSAIRDLAPRVLRGHKFPLAGVTFLSDERLLTLDRSQRLGIWDLTRGKALAVHTLRAGEVMESRGRPAGPRAPRGASPLRSLGGNLVLCWNHLGGLSLVSLEEGLVRDLVRDSRRFVLEQFPTGSQGEVLVLVGTESELEGERTTPEMRERLAAFARDQGLQVSEDLAHRPPFPEVGTLLRISLEDGAETKVALPPFPSDWVPVPDSTTSLPTRGELVTLARGPGGVTAVWSLEIRPGASPRGILQSMANLVSRSLSEGASWRKLGESPVPCSGLRREEHGERILLWSSSGELFLLPPDRGRTSPLPRLLVPGTDEPAELNSQDRLLISGDTLLWSSPQGAERVLRLTGYPGASDRGSGQPSSPPPE